MKEINWIEIVGYMASIFIAMSIMMSSMIRLRTFNLIGALLLGTYGVLIESVPIVLLNFFVGCANVYYIWKMLRNKKEDIRNLNNSINKQ